MEPTDAVTAAGEGLADGGASSPVEQHPADGSPLAISNAFEMAPNRLILRPVSETFFSAALTIRLTETQARGSGRESLASIALPGPRDSGSVVRLNLRLAQDDTVGSPDFDPHEPQGQLPALRDQRRANPPTAAFYLFASADDEAVAWGFVGNRESRGAVLRDQLTIGDLHVGVGCVAPFGGRLAVGWVKQTLKYNDRTGDHDVSIHQNFAALSYSLTL